MVIQIESEIAIEIEASSWVEPVIEVKNEQK